jgi:hypothetical protein
VYQKLHLKVFLPSAAALLAFSGCTPKKQVSGARVSDTSQASGEGVRMALRALSADAFPEVDFATFMGKGAIGAPEIDRSGVLPGRILEMFSPSYAIQVYPLNEANLRKETFSVRSRLSPARVLQSGMAVAFSSQFSVGSKIEVVRNFKDTTSAARAMPFNLMQLPLGAENALTLEEGTYVSFPIDGNIALNVSGSFLSRHGSFDGRLFEHIRAGGAGTLSGSMQGALIAKGKWRLQVLRLGGSKVRVRVVEDDRLGAFVGGGTSFHSATAFTYIPFGVVARALDLSHRAINNARVSIGKVSDLQKYTKIPDLILPEPLRRAKEESAMLGVAVSEGDRRMDQGIHIPDLAVDLARQGVDALQQKIDDAVNSQLQKVTSNLSAKLNEFDGRLRSLTNFTYNVSGSFLLNTDFARRHRFVADYVFDLSTPEAKMAYDHAVSGRSLWMGAVPQGMNLGDNLNNFSVAERLAVEDAGLDNPRVFRNVLGESTVRSRDSSVRFSGLWSSTGFTEQWKNNTTWMHDAAGNVQAWQAALWQFERSVSVPRGGESERLGSGILAPAGSSEMGTYWFAWKRRFPGSKPTAMQALFSEAINYGGPVAFATGLPGLFRGEFEGDKEASLKILFSQNAMRTIFDQTKVNDDLLWKALGNVALSFDNTFGLPFNTFGGLPSAYANSEAAKVACESVSKNWGAGYCSFFGNEFLPAFAAARANPNPWQRMKVFESFYTKGFLANKIGARLLVRYLTEVATLAYGSDVTKEVTLQFSVKNTKDGSAYASPTLVSATPDELQILETLGMGM